MMRRGAPGPQLPGDQQTLKILFDQFPVDTKGDTDIIDVTFDVQRLVQKAGVIYGMANVFVGGSTAAITTIEFEPGLIKDFKTALERIYPKNIPYSHDAAWGDENGYAHVRASMIGASISIPIHHGKMVLGTWQQIVVIDFDNRPRRREIIVQSVGVG